MDENTYYYSAAIELYTSSLRALEQRATAFLTTQSLLVAAFAVLFSRYYLEIHFSVFLIIVGICVIGFAFSLIFYLKHKVTSEDAAFWRAYARYLENNIKSDNKNLSKHQPQPALSIYFFSLRVQTSRCKSLP